MSLAPGIDPLQRFMPQEGPDTSDPGPHWQVRFWTIYIGQALSLLGSSLSGFVLLWWITESTGRISSLAAAGMSALLPQALLSPLGGVMADRFSRRQIIITSDLLSALCMVVMIALFLTERIQPWHIWTLLAVRSALQAFQIPAATASTCMLVPASFLMRAAGLNQAMQSLTVVAAAPLGALAISIMPMGWALGIDALTVLCGIGPLLYFPIPQMRSPGAEKTGIVKAFREGMTVIHKIPGLRPLFFLLAATVLVTLPAFSLLPMLVKQHFAGGAAQVALMEGLSGVGMVAGGLAISVLSPRRPITWVLIGFAGSCLGISLTALAPGPLFGVGVVWWVISGVCFVLGSAPLTAILQILVPNHLQGRALSILNMIMSLAAPVGLLLMIPLGQIWGVRGLFVGSGALGSVVCVAGFFFRRLMVLDRSAGAVQQDGLSSDEGRAYGSGRKSSASGMESR